MSADRATYVDSSALVKLAVREPESAALRRYLGRHRPLVSSALARTEVVRPPTPRARRGSTGPGGAGAGRPAADQRSRPRRSGAAGAARAPIARRHPPRERRAVRFGSAGVCDVRRAPRNCGRRPRSSGRPAGLTAELADCSGGSRCEMAAGRQHPRSLPRDRRTFMAHPCADIERFARGAHSCLVTPPDRWQTRGEAVAASSRGPSEAG